MKDGQRTLSRVAQPIKNIALRFAYAGLFISAFALMMLGKVDADVMERLRAQMTDAVAPILEVASKPLEAVEQIFTNVENMVNVFEENDRLRTERGRLMHWKALAEKLEAENRELRGLLNAVHEKEPRFVTGRVIADAGGVFSNSVIVNAGGRNGLHKGQAAVTEDGLVGRLTHVGSRSARILLVTDLNARIPVLVEETGARAIMFGANQGLPRLKHRLAGSFASEGDRIVTSGDAGVFPPGLAVGRVASVNEDGVLIQPFVDMARLDFVRILSFGPAGIVRPPEREDTRLKGPAVRPRAAFDDGAGEAAGTPARSAVTLIPVAIPNSSENAEQ